ncbi:hypothetical protein CONPUDRAFT_62226 [Coniophora puteana RWD-64-598 SS2]|uniref:Tc1-like transposase DDE domain-containing protein n=1 Tax=Coniophora puteana (strain RWD-64-598) TaxID=741705 RepID=A0A5M3MFI8_CONPW|nr:uncharacterized protein CONPUDRAFT_62226 [Coniophora puteana RWD-64-598 SS2]EIW77797.1 hypothetical protein CONPUDRAFT_62226 [Coniophora puteana RWD-64-598 SS2]
MVISRSQGHGAAHARRIRDWLHTFLITQQLPVHRIGQPNTSLLDDKDFALAIKLHLQSLAGKQQHFCAQDVVDFVETDEMQEKMNKAGFPRRTISVRTACRWLKQLDWRFGRRKNGMYIDGHEREDVVEYRKAFVKRWMEEYEPRMVIYDNDGNVVKTPEGFVLQGKYAGQRFRVLLVTHDESTFYANDWRQTAWLHTSSKATPQPKGEGESMMVSDFLVPEWGRLRTEDRSIHLFTLLLMLTGCTSDARLFFWAGKNRDGYFTSFELLAQVDRAIDIFEEKTNGFATGLFMFDNAPSHQKQAPDALSARRMPKNPHPDWTSAPGAPQMRPGQLPDGSPQQLYHPDDHPTMPGWFKGMEQILRERELWQDGLKAQCAGFKCKPSQTDCCCCRILFNQADFINQKSALQELVESRGHICDFYPKYHCELNFIEMYWDAAKFQYRNTAKTCSSSAMEKNVKACLDSIICLTFCIRRYANRAARFISAYAGGLTGAELAWVNRKYSGHRILPQFMINEVKASLGYI